MTPSTANSRLLEIRAAGTTSDWDTPETKGAPKFKGSAAVVYTERRERIRGEGTGSSSADVLSVRRTITMSPRSLPPGVEVEQRDTIVYIWKNVSRTGVVVSVEEFDMPGRNMPGSIRVVIDPED